MFTAFHTMLCYACIKMTLRPCEGRVRQRVASVRARVCGGPGGGKFCVLRGGLGDGARSQTIDVVCADCLRTTREPRGMWANVCSWRECIRGSKPRAAAQTAGNKLSSALF